MAENYNMDDLLRIMELLRAPGGCPWDMAQTHRSIRDNGLRRGPGGGSVRLGRPKAGGEGAEDGGRRHGQRGPGAARPDAGG